MKIIKVRFDALVISSLKCVIDVEIPDNLTLEEVQDFLYDYQSQLDRDN